MKRQMQCQRCARYKTKLFMTVNAAGIVQPLCLLCEAHLKTMQQKEGRHE